MTIQAVVLKYENLIATDPPGANEAVLHCSIVFMDDSNGATYGSVCETKISFGDLLPVIRSKITDAVIQCALDQHGLAVAATNILMPELRKGV